MVLGVSRIMHMGHAPQLRTKAAWAPPNKGCPLSTLGDMRRIPPIEGSPDPPPVAAAAEARGESERQQNISAWEVVVGRGQ